MVEDESHGQAENEGRHDGSSARSFPFRTVNLIIGVLLLVFAAIAVGMAIGGPSVIVNIPPVEAPPAGSVVLDPQPAGAESTPAEYRETLSQLQELYVLARYEDAVALAEGEILATGVIADLPLEYQIWVLHLVGNAGYAIGQLDAAAEHLEQATSLASDLGDDQVLGSVLVSSSVVEAERGNLELADAYLDDAEDLLREAGPQAMVALVLNRCALHLRDPSLLPQARESCPTALDLATEGGFESLQAAALVNLGLMALQDDDPEAALTRFAEAIAIAEATDTTRLLIAALNGRGLLRRVLQLYPEARDDFQRAVDLSRTVPNALDEARSLNNAALIFADCYDIEHARELFGLAQQLASGTGAQPVTQTATANLDALIDVVPPDEPPAAECANLVRLQHPQR